MHFINKGIFGKKNNLKHITIDGVRLHLLMKERKLWINGYWNLELNKTTTNILSFFIDSFYEVNQSDVFETTINKIIKKYKINRDHAKQDLNTLIGIINFFSRNEIPTNLVGISIINEKLIKAPNRMDLALTYRCNNKCPHCYLSENKSMDELAIEKWKEVIDKLWNIGVPQIVFTGGECFLRKDLIELVSYSKQFITGIISNGTMINEKIAKELNEAELDWIQITLESDNEKIHDEMQGRKGSFKETVKGIKNCIKNNLNVNINATLTKKNYKTSKKLINLARNLKVPSISFNAIINSGRGIEEKNKNGLSEKELNNILKELKEYAEKKKILINWFLPTCYNNLDPEKLGYGRKSCSACSINMLIQPDGSIIPCQSWTHQTLGNFLDDNWNSIWNSRLARKIRKHGFAEKKCFSCDKFNVCGGACPLDKINCGGCK